MRLRPAAALCLALLASCAAKQPWRDAMAPRPEVFVDVLPLDAEVRLDGHPVGRGSLTVALGSQPSELQVVAPGFEPAARTVDPATQSGARLAFALRPAGYGEARAVDLDEPTGLTAVSAALLRQKRPTEAAQYAERAVDLAPQLAPARRALGLALLQLPPSKKLRERAARELSAYLAGAPEAPDHAQIESLVERLRGDFAMPLPGEKPP